MAGWIALVAIMLFAAIEAAIGGRETAHQLLQNWIERGKARSQAKAEDQRPGRPE
ncbi:hypothetical protein [Pusillimonas sp.]|uniref:hypothetical protein n=1 Tax=Pusillimonas sp. TaxID=3040095 RepID=UPI00299FAE05|nr:hypothetical protein [Pusillimonas sp.]MDX3895957.1 hypothetical protein [Pusillimonas sp.]